MTASPLATVRQVVRDRFPGARVSTLAGLLRITIEAVPERDVRQELRQALPAAELRPTREQDTRHGGRRFVFEIGAVSGPVPGGPLQLGRGAA